MVDGCLVVFTVVLRGGASTIPSARLISPKADNHREPGAWSISASHCPATSGEAIAATRRSRPADQRRQGDAGHPVAAAADLERQGPSLAKRTVLRVFAVDEVSHLRPGEGAKAAEKFPDRLCPIRHARGDNEFES